MSPLMNLHSCVQLRSDLRGLLPRVHPKGTGSNQAEPRCDPRAGGCATKGTIPFWKLLQIVVVSGGKSI